MNSPSEALRILLLEADTRQALPVARALREAGHVVMAVCEKYISYGSWSRYPHRRFYSPASVRSEAEYLSFLTDLLQSEPVDIVIPLFDFSATILSKHKTLLEQYARIPVPHSEVFMLARDKYLTMEICRQHGIAHPVTYRSDEPDLESKLDYPCLIKPNIGSGAVGITRVNDPGELREALGRLRPIHGPCHIQEFIPHHGTQYKVQIFRGSSGVVHGAVVYSKLRYYPVTGGTSSLNVTVDRPDLIDLCTRLTDAMNWTSHADVDLIEDPRDGVVKVMEVNPRVTGSIKLSFEAGVDFADLIVREAMEWDVPVHAGYSVGMKMRYLPLDILWFIYSPERWKAQPSWFSFFGRDICYQEGTWSDPLPVLAGFMSGLKKFISRP